MRFYDISNVFARIVLRLISRYDIVGLENVPRSGPFIIVANHISWLDPPMLGAMLPRRIRFMAKEELFKKPIVGWVVKSYESFPVRRGEGDRQALRMAIEILKAGGVLGMFPEGTRSKSGRLQPGHAGAAMIALKAGVPILPIGITGTQNIFRFPDILTRPRFRVNIGCAFTLSQSEGHKDSLTDAREELMRRIAELLPMEYRGAYGSRDVASKTS